MSAVVAVVFLTVGTVEVAATAGIASADSIVATIPVGYSDAIAINPAGTDAYITTLNNVPAVSVVDLSNNTITATVPVGTDPDAIAINPAGTDAYVANGGSDTVSVIKLSTNTITATIHGFHDPDAIAVNPAGTEAYVANGGSDTVSVIKLSNNTVTATIHVGANPDAIAINPAGSDAYVANAGSDTVSVVRLSTNTVTASIPGFGDPDAVAVNPTGTDAYVANGSYGIDFSVSVIGLSTDTVTATIYVDEIPEAVAFNAAGTGAYVTGPTSPNPGGGQGAVSVIDPSTNTVTTSIGVGGAGSSYPAGVAVNPAGTDAYITDLEFDEASVLSLTPAVAGTPGRPTATGGDHQSRVIVTAPTTGGTPTFYTVTAADSTRPGHGGQTCTVNGPGGACTVTGLTDGDTYTFTATATNSAGTSGASPASNPVIPAASTDIAVSISGPTTAAGGSVFTEKVTVTDLGPSHAVGVSTNIFVPPGLTVTAAPGATFDSGTLDWTDPSLTDRTSVVHHVEFKVGAALHDAATIGAALHDAATIGAVAESDGHDPNPANNLALATIRLVPHAPRTKSGHG